MTQPAPEPQPQAVVQPKPSPTTFQIMPTGSGNIVVIINMVSGQTVVFLSPSDAKAVAANLDRTASQAQSGLMTPPTGLIVPGK